MSEARQAGQAIVNVYRLEIRFNQCPVMHHLPHGISTAFDEQRNALAESEPQAASELVSLNSTTTVLQEGYGGIMDLADCDYADGPPFYLEGVFDLLAAHSRYHPWTATAL